MGTDTIRTDARTPTPGLRARLAVEGVRTTTPVARSGGAGPSDDGHVRLGGLRSALPVVSTSPWSIDRTGRLIHDTEGDVDVEVEVGSRPAFYDLQTADGVPYHQLARLHGGNVLASTVIQTCMRYGEEDRCKFCAIEQSLEAGMTTATKSPAQLAEVAKAAVELDGIEQVVLTTGTTPGPDRGVRYLARCVQAITDAVPGLPVQAQCEPPADLRFITELFEAGTTAIGIHVEAMDDRIRREWMPGKGAVPLSEYWDAWHEAVRVFGRNRVSTYLLVGLGEDPDELIADAARLIAAGVYPFAVPFRPLAGTLAVRDGRTAPTAAQIEYVTQGIAAHLRAAGMVGEDQKAGCAACGACSALSAAGG